MIKSELAAVFVQAILAVRHFPHTNVMNSWYIAHVFG